MVEKVGTLYGGEGGVCMVGKVGALCGGEGWGN